MSRKFAVKPVCFLVLQALATLAYADASSDQVQNVTIIGQGQSRQVQSVSNLDLIEDTPGSSPLKTLEKLPGVNFQSADPFGAYEWSTRFSVRGFAQTQMGFTLDGVPLGDMSYGNNNGLHISRAISSENIGRATVSQGAGALNTASTSNLGGTAQFYTLDPSDQFGVSGAQTVGSDSTLRTFARLDTGLIGSGTKLYLSVTRQRAEKTKGSGDQDQDMFNSKLVQNFGENRFTAFYNYSNRTEVDYQDMSLNMLGRLGYNWDNYAPDWQRAVNAAKGIYTGGVTSMDDAYYQGSGLRKDNLMGASLSLRFSDDADLKTTVYHHDNKGQGHWYTPYAPAGFPALAPISIRTTEYSIARNGVTSDLNWDFGPHAINAGFWYEDSNHDLTRNYYAITGPQDMNYFLSNPTLTAFAQTFNTKTTVFYAQDTWSLMDNRLKVNAGFKAPKVTIDAVSLVGTRAAGTLTAQNNFLPQLGLNYSLSKTDEVFASVSKNMRAFQPGVDGPFSQTQAAFNANAGNMVPETSISYDLGYRFRNEAVQGSVAVYHTDFDNRLLNIATCAGIVGCASTFANVGKVETNGVEAVAIWKLAKEWSWFNSVSYNDSQYKTNYIDNNAVVAVAGKQVVDSPKLTFSTEMSYENAGWYGRLGGKFTDKRYYTYLNDAGVPSYWLMNLTAGYKQAAYAGLKDVTVQFNVSNLLNKQYIATVGSNGFEASDPNGTFQTLLTGAPRQFFITLSGKY